jgi:hypothetical protein
VHVPLRIVTLCLLVLSLGLHWTLLQTVAWSGMLISSSRDGTFWEAVVKTFDGQHPCALCKVVTDGRKAEHRQQQQEVNPGPKLELGLIWTATEFQLTQHREQVPPSGSPTRSRADEPPQPPPRVFPDDHARA